MANEQARRRVVEDQMALRAHAQAIVDRLGDIYTRSAHDRVPHDHGCVWCEVTAACRRILPEIDKILTGLDMLAKDSPEESL